MPRNIGIYPLNGASRKVLLFGEGEMLEWLKRHAWKACKRQKRFLGSNPCLSAIGRLASLTPACGETGKVSEQLDRMPSADCRDYGEIPVGEKGEVRSRLLGAIYIYI